MEFGSSLITEKIYIITFFPQPYLLLFFTCALVTGLLLLVVAILVLDFVTQDYFGVLVTWKKSGNYYCYSSLSCTWACFQHSDIFPLLQFAFVLSENHLSLIVQVVLCWGQKSFLLPHTSTSIISSSSKVLSYLTILRSLFHSFCLK